MCHADPERGIVVGRPVAIGDLNGRQVAIEQRTGAYFLGRFGLQFDAAVGILNCFAM
jgi:hypothetical protein